MDDLRAALIALVACVQIGCASALPAHQWIPIQRVEAVDLFWWEVAMQCDLRVIYWEGPDDIRGFTVPNVDARLCGRTK